MAKIKFYTPTGQLPKGREIKSIAGEDCANNYKERLQKQRELAKQQHIARIKAKDVVLLEQTDS